ncbi:MAG: ABC transporter ATP-binding protein [Microbacteriaceae bacterium]|nr:ABC transporter ATP-binding protein [Microbacteriaceae bacterium]
MVLGRAHRVVPGVLPGRRRGAARAGCPRPHPSGPHALLRRRVLADAPAAASARRRALPPACAASRGRQRGRRRRGRRGVDRHARGHRTHAHPTGRSGLERPGRTVGADLRLHRARARRGRLGRDPGPGALELPTRRGDRVTPTDETRGATAPAPAVRARGVGKTFAATGGEVLALTGVDLEVAAGEFVSLIGPSGCGKSTLLRLVADLDQASAGELEVFGKTPQKARVDQDYGIAFQQAGLLPWRTVAGNISLPLELHRMGRAERDERVAQLAGLVGLSEFVDRYPDQLSGGMQQRVAIARALAENPRLLLMDEPFGALDEMTREYLQSELARIASETGAAVVFVTHSIPEAVYLSDRVVVMSPRPGRITDVIETGFGEERPEGLRESEAYFAKVTAVREALHGSPVERANER